MTPTRFFDRIKDLGQFRCSRDLRHFKRQQKRNPEYSLASYLSHFGHCKNGEYHHCEFELKPEHHTQVQVVGYQRVSEFQGQQIRRKSNAFTYWGRGRRWAANRKKK